jgi:hypothetical protein
MYKNKIYLYERSNKNNFFIKNKDQLLTGIISAILGGLAVLFVQYIVDYFRWILSYSEPSNTASLKI